MRKGRVSLVAKIVFTVMLSLAGSAFAGGQTADQAWLKYAPLKNPPNVPMNVRSLGRGTVEQSAVIELRRGLLSLSGKPGFDGGPNFILLGTAEEMRSRTGQGTVPTLEPDEFLISWGKPDLVRELDIIGGSERGVLYGVFALLRNLAQGADDRKLNVRERPSMSGTTRMGRLNGGTLGGRSSLMEGKFERISRLSGSMRGCWLRSASTDAT
jgi:alpha-glucuronidase